MASLTAAYDTHAKDGELIAYGLAANTTIFKGALVEVVTGFVQPAGDTAARPLSGSPMKRRSTSLRPFCRAGRVLPGRPAL